MYPITTGRLHKNFRIINLELKEIQKTTDDYVTDFLSYQKCLNNYYERHGADTEWLVKIFAERYDLERFNISPEDVLDDFHKIMKEKPMFPSLKEMSLNGTEVSPIKAHYSNNVSDEELLFHGGYGTQLELYCIYSPVGDTGDANAVPSFISEFSECLVHKVDGFYGKDVYIILEAVDDILIVTLEYTYQPDKHSYERPYCMKFFMDFTPGKQMHCACSSQFPDKYNRNKRDIMKEVDIALLFNCMSISMWNEDMQDKGYYASFDIENDDSEITLNDEHCTITEYIAEAFNVKSSLKPFVGSKEQLLPSHIRDLADKMKEKRERGIQEGRQFFEQLVKDCFLE